MLGLLQLPSKVRDFTECLYFAPVSIIKQSYVSPDENCQPPRFPTQGWFLPDRGTMSCTTDQREDEMQVMRLGFSDKHSAQV
jgi:hypothetical protein